MEDEWEMNGWQMNDDVAACCAVDGREHTAYAQTRWRNAGLADVAYRITVIQFVCTSAQQECKRLLSNPSYLVASSYWYCSSVSLYENKALPVMMRPVNHWRRRYSTRVLWSTGSTSWSPAGRSSTVLVVAPLRAGATF